MIAHEDFVPWPEALADEYRAQGLWQDKSLSTLLQKACTRAPEHVAIVDQHRSWTYQQLQNAADELAVGFFSFGIAAGDRVVVQLPNCGQMFEVLFALIKLGAVPVLALPAHRGFEIRHFIEFAQAKAYVICDVAGGFDYRELARHCCEDMHPVKVIVHGDAQEFCSLKSLYLSGTVHNQVDPTAPALLQLSGGTTGAPKLIPRTHNDYLYSVRESVNICGFGKTTVYLAVMPVCHNFTLSSPGALGVFHAGGTLILSDSGAPDAAFDLIDRHGVSHCALVPPLAIAWMNALHSRPRRLPSLQLLQVGGAKFSAQVAMRFFKYFHCQLQQVFGMAEGLVNYTRLTDDLETIVHCQGRPMSAFDEVRVVDELDQPVPKGEVGHLQTRGPYTIRGYYRAPEHNRKAFTSDGFYRTGDLVREIDGGYLVVEGRDKDQINRGGEKISAEEVENQLLAHVDVLDAAVVAMPDAYLGERTCALVILKDKARPLSLIQARKFLKARGLADYKLPDKLETVDAFVTTKMGKVDKRALRERFASLPATHATGV